RLPRRRRVRAPGHLSARRFCRRGPTCRPERPRRGARPRGRCGLVGVARASAGRVNRALDVVLAGLVLAVGSLFVLLGAAPLALVRCPPAATTEIQSLNAIHAFTHFDLARDPVLYGDLPPREISMQDVFRSCDSSKKFKIAEGQWYRYAASYVSPAYHLLEGFPFIQEPPSGDLQERVLIRHHDYDQCFQSVQLLQWNSQVKFNVTVYRNLSTTRDSIMTS